MKFKEDELLILYDYAANPWKARLKSSLKCLSRRVGVLLPGEDRKGTINVCLLVPKTETFLNHNSLNSVFVEMRGSRALPK